MNDITKTSLLNFAVTVFVLLCFINYQTFSMFWELRSTDESIGLATSYFTLACTYLHNLRSFSYRFRQMATKHIKTAGARKHSNECFCMFCLLVSTFGHKTFVHKPVFDTNACPPAQGKNKALGKWNSDTTCPIGQVVSVLVWQ